MINTHIKDTIKQIINLNLPNHAYRVFIFGSRAVGNSRKFSDIDLGLLGSAPLTPKEYMTLKFAFEDSDLPYRIDLVDFYNVSDEFKKISLTNVINI